MKCQHCEKYFEEREIHEHHIHPRFMDNKKGDGRKAYLCEKCHNILHLMIPKFIWEEVKDKEQCLKVVIRFTETYCKLKRGEENGDTNSII